MVRSQGLRRSMEKQQKGSMNDLGNVTTRLATQRENNAEHRDSLIL